MSPPPFLGCNTARNDIDHVNIHSQTDTQIDVRDGWFWQSNQQQGGADRVDFIMLTCIVYLVGMGTAHREREKERERERDRQTERERDRERETERQEREREKTFPHFPPSFAWVIPSFFFVHCRTRDRD
jgi:hypothetical protein